MTTYESDINSYVNKVISERRKEEKTCKKKSRNLKKSASLFVARRMNAIAMHRDETLDNMTLEA